MAAGLPPALLHAQVGAVMSGCTAGAAGHGILASGVARSRCHQLQQQGEGLFQVTVSMAGKQMLHRSPCTMQARHCWRFIILCGLPSMGGRYNKPTWSFCRAGAAWRTSPGNTVRQVACWQVYEGSPQLRGVDGRHCGDSKGQPCREASTVRKPVHLGC